MGVGTHYIYRGMGDGFVWILDFWILGLWAWWDGGDKKVGFAEKKTVAVGVGVG